MKLHIQLEKFNGIKFDFIEVEVKADQIPTVYKKLGEVFKGVKVETHAVVAEFVTPNPAQMGLIKKLGGDVNKKYKTWADFQAEVDALKNKKNEPQTPPAEVGAQVGAGDAPWDLDL